MSTSAIALIILVHLSEVVNAIFSWTKYLLSLNSKIIFIFCTFYALVDISGTIMANFNISNIFLIYIFIWIETLIIIQLLYNNSSTIRRISIKWLYILTSVAFGILILVFENAKHFSPWGAALQSVIVVTACICYFKDELKVPKSMNVIKDPMFWIASVFLIYYGSVWLIYFGSQFFINDPKTFVYLWNGHNVLVILRNIFIFIGIACLR